MKFLIPSYGRCGKVTTAEMLVGYGVSPSDIVIGVQTEEDHSAYSREYRRFRVAYAEASCAAGNRNNLLRMLEDGERAVLMDDDIKRISKVALSNDKKKARLLPIEADEFASLIDVGFSLLDKVGGKGIWGVTHISNTMILRRELAKGNVVKANQLIEGSFMGVVGGGGVRFDESVEYAEDYECCLHTLTNGGSTFRINTHTVIKPDNGSSEGGCAHLYAKGKKYLHDAQQRDIIERYPGLIGFTTKDPECISLMVKVRL